MTDNLFADTDIELPDRDLQSLRQVYNLMREAVVKPRQYEAGEEALAYLQRRLEQLTKERNDLREAYEKEDEAQETDLE